MFYEPHIDRVELQCPRLPAPFDGLTILHLSDLHITRWTRRLTLWQAALHSLRPDLVVVTGDLGHRAWLWKTSLPNIARLLDAIPTTLGTYFILGNHDSLKLGSALAKSDRRYLRNQAVILERANSNPGDQRLALIGIDQHRRIDTDIPSAMQAVHASDFKLMVLHYPDLIFSAAAAGADVCLAGHTHGGQICWPDGQPIIRHDSLPQEMCTGMHRIANTWMIVNRGIGVAGLRMRLFCPPQAILITLRCHKADLRASPLKAAQIGGRETLTGRPSRALT